jgi:membrane-associated phospholipid phosphatase
MSMESINAWVGAHVVSLLLGLILLVVTAALLHWRGRPAWSDDVPVPLLHRRATVWIVVAGLCAFAALAFAIDAGGRLVTFDQRVTAHVAATLGESSLRLMAAISELGAPDVLTALGVLVALGLLLTGHRLLGVAWCATVLGSGFVISLSKQVFERPRPVHEHGFALESSWSFPSGHASGSLVFYGMLAYIAMVRLPSRWHLPLALGALVMILAIGATRVLLQVHYVSDVAAGYAVGLAWLALGVMLTEWLRTAHRPPTSGLPPDPA